MSEPGFPSSAVAAARRESLWENARGWRTLTIAASLLTLAAVATPLLLEPPADVEHPIQPKAIPAPVTTGFPPVPALPHASPTSSALSQPSTPTLKPKAVIKEKRHITAVPTRTALLPAQPTTRTQPEVACEITISSQVVPMGGGIVTGYMGALAAQQRMIANERAMGGLITPAFANTPRALVQMDGGAPDAGRQIVVVPPGMTVDIGDHITFNNAHRDASLPCGFVPPLVTSDSGPALTATKSPVAGAEP